MSITIENILLIGSLLLLVSIFIGKTSYRFGIPVLILFLVVGMLAGSEGIGGIYFDNPALARFIGVMALNFILFSGGLDTRWDLIRPVFWQGISLSTLGVLFTTITTGLFISLITDFSIYEGLLLGAIVSSTDAAAVFSILRSKNMALKGRVRSVLEFESGSNDPMAYVLTIALIGLVTTPGKSLLSVLPFLAAQMLIGGALGYLSGRASRFILNHIRLTHEGLYPVLMIALMFITFSVADLLHGNGFLAIYIAAVYLGNQEFIHKNTILKMFDSLAWLMQIILFLTLGLLVFPSHVFPVIGIGLLISVFLILVARPVSVLLSTLPFRTGLREKLYLSWAGLRGAVPIVFATYPLLAGVEKADMIFNVVFFISLTSVMLQGTTLNLFARWLKVTGDAGEALAQTAERFSPEKVKRLTREITIRPGSTADGKQVVELNFPENAIIAFIYRDGNYLTPGGSTRIMAGDVLLVLCENEQSLEMVEGCLNG
ncbi:MAG: potassium/proton antiporter [Bacteroidota bacterium]